VENETQIMHDLKYGEKHWKNEKNEKCTLYELNYGKKTGQQGKWDTHMLRPEIWQETLKRW